MAFIKRNWLARIGIGLNKFIIGDKDGEGKQTLTNSPDSITQQGDVISADNLNDLEDRIKAGIDSLENEIDSTKMILLWENPSPYTAYSGGTIYLSDSSRREYILEYIYDLGNQWVHEFAHMYFAVQDINNTMILSKSVISTDGGNSLVTVNRNLTYDVDDPSITIGGAQIMTVADGGAITVASNNNFFIPVALFKVGDIYD